MSEAASQTPPTLSCAVRDARIADALETVAREAFPPLRGSWRELGDDALVRVLEDLRIRGDAHVLVGEPLSGLLPAVISRIAAAVTVVCSDTDQASVLRSQLSAASIQNVWVTSFVQDRESDSERCFDRILVLQPAQATLAPVLDGLLHEEGSAIWAVDGSMPPRRMRRVMHIDADTTLEEDLDLVQYMPMLGDMLVEAGCVLRQEIAQAVLCAREQNRKLGEELLERGVVREDDLFRILAEQRRMPFARTSEVLEVLDLELVKQLPRKYLDHLQFVPIEQRAGRVRVITSDPNLPIWDLQAVFDGAVVVPELATPTDIRRVWTAIELGFVDRAKAAPQRRERVDVARDDAPPATEDSRAVGLFDAILLDAVAERSSDIHLESYQGGSRLRFRIDGSLHDVDRYNLAHDDFVALLNVVKISANLDIAERRAPQGGRIHRKVGGHALDLRVQTQPTLHDESVVIRILPQDRRPPTIEELGFEPAVADRYRRLLQDPQGLILVVGATGSGKSTTLYAGLQVLARDPSRKVITIEDPVEFTLEGIQQTQVNNAVGFRFAEAVRAFLRQDPDVILVGEVRDGETALEAIRAAQTGHLVLATLHSNDTVDAVQRLTDLGMHPNSIAGELTAVIAQRLARRICTGCKRPAMPDKKMLAELFPAGAPRDFRCFEGTGCERCRGNGTHGRVAVVEMLPVGPEIRRAIASNAVLDDLRELAHSSEMMTLRDSALRLVQDGTIPMSELYDVLSAEQMRPRDEA